MIKILCKYSNHSIFTLFVWHSFHLISYGSLTLSNSRFIRLAFTAWHIESRLNGYLLSPYVSLFDMT